MARKIPEQFLGEYSAKQTALIKSRVRLFCALVFVIYVLVSIVSYAVSPEEFKYEEIPVWMVLVALSLAILYANRRARAIKTAKLVAYLFTALLLALLTRLNIIYYEYADLAAPLYLFMLFLVSFTIPWTLADVIPITFMHILAFTYYFLHVQRFMPEAIKSKLGLSSYYDGLTFLLMAFILCLVIRRKETARDVENFILLKEIERKNEQMQRELELATRVHKTLIPKSISTDLVDIAVMYLPMYYMGGDYAKFHFVDKEKMLFIVCDVTGHGVSAALLVNRIHAEFERCAKEGKEPGILLKELNDFIVKDFEGINMYLSAFSCLLNFRDMKIIYSNHGHPPQYIYRVTASQIRRLEPQASLLGLFIKDESPCQNEIDFSKGDRLFLFTDGVIEAKNRAGEEYGRERLERFITANHDLGVDVFNKRLLEELSKFKTGDFKDDIFMLNIHVKK